MNELEKINLRIENLENRKKALTKAIENTDRKQRTRRLIQTGALCEKYFEIEHLSIEDREEVFKIFANFFKSNLPEKYKKKE